MDYDLGYQWRTLVSARLDEQLEVQKDVGPTITALLPVLAVQAPFWL
jgi:hypothetical protein